MKRFSCFLFLCLALVACPVHAVSLRPDSSIDKPMIRLSDVFDGFDLAHDADIALAPAPGKSVTYDMRVLAGLSGRYNLGWTPEQNDKIVLSRSATVVTAEAIRQAIANKIAEKKGDALFDLRFDVRPTGFTLPSSDAASFDLSAFDYDPVAQKFRVTIVAQNNGTPVAQPISGRVISQRNVPVLTHAMASGSIVREEDIVMLSVDEQRLDEDVLSSAAQIVGRSLTRNKSEGEKLRARDLIAPRSIKRGELVMLKVETNRFLLTAQGKALQDGATGETIRVTNTQSNRTVEGTIVAPGIVLVGAAQTTARTE